MKAPLSRQKKAKTGIVSLFLALVLLGTATPVQAGLMEEASSCSDEDQTKGFNGQSVDCAFYCDGPAGVVSVAVAADDKDATVSGNGECAGGKAHCDGPKTCNDNDDYDGSGAGTCNADSDEFYDSGLHVSCSSEIGEPPVCTPPTGCRPPDWCIVSEPVPLCVNPWPPVAGLPPEVAGPYGEVVNTGRELWESLPTEDLFERLPSLDPEDWIPNDLPGPNDLIPDDLPGKNEAYEVTRTVSGIVKGALDVEAGVEIHPIDPSLIGASSAEANVWERALSVLPTLPWEAATKDSYVFMHFDGETAIGITCRHGVCTDFQPVLINDPTTGFRLSTP